MKMAGLAHFVTAVENLKCDGLTVPIMLLYLEHKA
jgi:hypothetical protein